MPARSPVGRAKRRAIGPIGYRPRVLYVALAFWLLVGGGVFLVALGGGPGATRAQIDSETSLAKRLRRLGFIVVFAFGLAVPIAVAIANGHDKARQGPSGITLTRDEALGRQLFARSCATCHTLAAARAVGHVGPNLDLLAPPESLVLNAIENGRARGRGDMPAGIFVGAQARDVAQFVAAVAGR